MLQTVKFRESMAWSGWNCSCNVVA